MAKLIDHLDQLLPAFEAWYAVDHGPNEDFYDNQITQKRLSAISDENLIEFFVKFRREGGHIQSGGGHCLDEFKDMLQDNMKDFKKHILEPFSKNFNLNNWLEKRKKFRQWGIGIATIYLVRINKNKYPVLNKKTIKALNLLGFEDIRCKNINTYQYVHDIQRKIINSYPQIDNYFKADALCHFILAEDKGKEIIENILKLNKDNISVFIDKLDNERAIISIQSDKTLLSKNQILARINELSNGESETVRYKGKQLKRNSCILALIKRLYGYQCQFCDKKIVKKDGSLYIEACHINQKSKGGIESLNNILILCPNCHKEFDLGDRKKILHSKEKYIVEVNGKRHSITFEKEAS